MRKRHDIAASGNYPFDLSAEEATVVEMMRGAAEIIRSAQLAGYLDERLQFTKKEIEPKRGTVPGFQTGLVRDKEDIEAELDFLKGPAAIRCCSALGMAMSTTRLLDLAAYKERHRKRFW